MLNNQIIANMGRVDTPRKYFDGQGMYLYLQPSGAKYWRLKYRFEGREKTLAIGTYPRISLDDARMKTDEAKQQLIMGIDPSEFKQNQGFEIVAREWFDNERGGWRKRHAYIVIDSLEKDVFPYIGVRHIGAIRPPELLTVIRRIEKRGALQVATKVLQRIRAVFRYAVQTGRVNNNPAVELMGVVKTKRVQHRLMLEPNEMGGFIKAVKVYGGMVSTRNALLLMLLTFVRTDELRNAVWEEFDLEEAIWRIPAERTKKDTVHIVPLSQQAIVLLQSVPSYGNKTGYLFEGRTKGKAFSSKTMISALYQMGYKDKATIHGIRGLASTVLNESGRFDIDVIERQLSHVEGNAVRRAYNHAQYLPERKIMMQWWADYLDKKTGQYYQLEKKTGVVGRVASYLKDLRFIKH